MKKGDERSKREELVEELVVLVRALLIMVDVPSVRELVGWRLVDEVKEVIKKLEEVM